MFKLFQVNQRLQTKKLFARSSVIIFFFKIHFKQHVFILQSPLFQTLTINIT